jgi:hypothetical protein
LQLFSYYYRFGETMEQAAKQKAIDARYEVGARLSGAENQPLVGGYKAIQL